MYQFDKNINNRTNLLYHFTTGDSLLKILQNMELKLSNFTNLNDLNELDLNCYWSNSTNHLKITRFIKKECKLFCFTQDYFNEEDNKEEGFNHPRMWAQYANNNSGVCLVLNEKKLIQYNKKVLNNKFYKIETVNYQHKLYEKSISDDSHERNFIEKYYQNLFFKKHIDWEHERERRFFCIEGPDYLSINNCIEYIILGNKFNDEMYFELANTILINDLKIIPHKIKKQLNSDGKIELIDFEFRLYEIIKNYNKLSNKYLKFIKSNGYEI